MKAMCKIRAAAALTLSGLQVNPRLRRARAVGKILAVDRYDRTGAGGTWADPPGLGFVDRERKTGALGVFGPDEVHGVLWQASAKSDGGEVAIKLLDRGVA